MPFYEYQCQACGAQVEVMQKINDAPLKKCTQCGKSRLVKLVSAPVFRLKGGGWYETDFKSDKENKRNLVETETAAAPADKTETKTDAKADTKADASADKKPDKKAEAPAAKPASASKRRTPARAAKPAKKPAAKRKAR
jgi:putative FmdB family regulatory protein